MDKVNCPGCDRSFRISSEHRGRRFKCPLCGHTFQDTPVQGEVVPAIPVVVHPTPVSTSQDALTTNGEIGASLNAPLQQLPSTSPPNYLAPSSGKRQQPKKKQRSPLFWLAIAVASFLVLVFCTVAAWWILSMMPPPEELADAFQTPEQSLLEAREGRQTQLRDYESDDEPPEKPPEELFDLVQYPTSLGDMAAYLSVDPGDGKKHPAIIWLFGGFGNGIGSTAWERASPLNDQSASQYRKEGMIMMYPSLRGSCGNPGNFECLYGEVNDVLDAAKFLAQQPFVDKKRIYIGGHSTGGTLALLCAASSDQFAGCVSIGPVDNVAGYGQPALPFSVIDDEEVKFRSPIFWQHAIDCPTWIIEGEGGNADCARILGRNAEAIRKKSIRVFVLPGFDHFTVLSLANQRMAQILNGKADESSLLLSNTKKSSSFE